MNITASETDSFYTCTYHTCTKTNSWTRKSWNFFTVMLSVGFECICVCRSATQDSLFRILLSVDELQVGCLNTYQTYLSSSASFSCFNGMSIVLSFKLTLLLIPLLFVCYCCCFLWLSEAVLLYWSVASGHVSAAGKAGGNQHHGQVRIIAHCVCPVVLQMWITWQL